MRSRGRVVRSTQAFAWKFVLLAVVHATRSEGLSSTDIATSGPTPTATEEGECRKSDAPETYYANDSEPDDETLILTVSA